MSDSKFLAAARSDKGGTRHCFALHEVPGRVCHDGKCMHTAALSRCRTAQVKRQSRAAVLEPRFADVCDDRF